MDKIIKIFKKHDENTIVGQTSSKTPIDMSLEITASGSEVEIRVFTSPIDVCEVSLYIDNELFEAINITDGMGHIFVNDLANGMHSIYVEFSGNSNYMPCNISDELILSKMHTDMSLEVADARVGETVPIVVNMTDADEDFVVYLFLDNELLEPITIKDGKGCSFVDGLEGGSHIVYAEYRGSSKYDSCSISGEFNVSKAHSDMSLDVEDILVGDDEHISVTMGIEDEVVFVDLYIDNEMFQTLKVVDGKGTAVIGCLAAGSHTIYADYRGGSKYEPCNATTDFNVSKMHSDMSLEVEDARVGETVPIVVNMLEEDEGFVVYLFLDNELLEPIVIKDGNGCSFIDGLESGSHIIYAEYKGSPKYMPCSATMEFNIV